MKKRSRILLFGADGQLGQEFRFLSEVQNAFEFSFYSRREVDITQEKQVAAVVKHTECDFIINCAAYTAVDKAESDKETCFQVNAYGPGILAKVASSAGVKLVHFSTDYLYHTYDGFPLTEDSPTSPKGVYASSKLAGEVAIRNEHALCLILRTSWVISGFGHNFIKTMLRLGNEKNSLNVVNDQYGTPTYTRDLAHAVLEIIQKKSEGRIPEETFNQTYNYSSEGVTTWYELAEEVMRFGNMCCQINSVHTSEYPTPAKRPQWSVLSKQKIKENLGIEVPHWHDALKRCLKDNF
jgi:dTDP-4-dehydrorhamnose reductase